MRGTAILRAAEDAARPKGTRSKDPKEPPSDRFTPSDWRLHRRIRDDFRAVELTAQDGKERGSDVECPSGRSCGKEDGTGKRGAERHGFGVFSCRLPPEDVRKLTDTMAHHRGHCHVCGQMLVESEFRRVLAVVEEDAGSLLEPEARRSSGCGGATAVFALLVLAALGLAVCAGTG